MRSPRPHPFLAATGLILLTVGVGACGSAATDGSGSATNVPTSDVPTSDVGTSDVPTSDAPATTVAGNGAVPAALGRVAWHVEGNITVGGIVSAPAGSTAAITFGTDGTVTVDTGCNSGSGTVTYSHDDQLQVSDLAVTERACVDEAPASLERTILAVLAEPLVWVVEGDHLTVYPMTVTDTGLRLVAGN